MKVFLASTAEDLTEYRRIAETTIRDLSEEIQIVAMEHFGPRPETPIKECERLAQESDIVVCIVAHRYGSIPEDGEKSFTQREVEVAHSAGKKILAWIVDKDYKWTENKEQDLLLDPTVYGDSTREAEVQQRIKKLVEFKAWLGRTVIADSFTTPDDFGRRVAVALHKYIPIRATAKPLPPHKISIARLPITGSDLFGREAELKILDYAWDNPPTNIVSFVAWGGVGKTALVNHWLKQRMARDNYRGADRVYGWTFFSQGTSEQAASADLFIDQILRWFDDPDPTAGNPWDKGERVARYIRQSRVLLILDGLEPLQHPPGPLEGRLKDAAMQSLLVELAAGQPGLCVISTREQIGDLVEFENSTVIQRNLEHLSAEAGAEVLRSFNVKGEIEELEAVARELRGHAFSLTLLGSYLDEVLNGEIHRHKEIENLFDDSRYGDAAQKMISAYVKWLGEGKELAILRLLGLFDRPADIASLQVLRESPAIPGLTESLQSFKAREWNQAVAKLRRIKLLTEASPENPGTLDAHPLVREFFKHELKQTQLSAWRAAHKRIYKHLIRSTKEFPETIEEMSPLFAAVAHGCAAGLYENALSEVYERRIQRDDSLYFSTRQLGAISAILATLSNFFDSRWERPVPELAYMDQGFLLNEAGATLRSLGRLQEASQALQAAVEIAITHRRWSNASTAAGNLSQVFLNLGDLERAMEVARQGVDLADQSQVWYERVHNRSYLANALHQCGYDDLARDRFAEAEEIQKEEQHEFPLLYSVSGHVYCDWLLDQRRVEEVKERATRALEIAISEELGFLSTALDNLSLAHASLLEMEQAGVDPAETIKLLNVAIDGLRKAEAIYYLPSGLLLRAQFYSKTRDFEKAERDLGEVYRIVVRGSMGLGLADYHLEFARLRFIQGNKVQAREHLEIGKELIARRGYHRRDKDVAELEAQLA